MNRRMLLALITVLTVALLVNPKSIGIGLGFVVFLTFLLLLSALIKRAMRR